jgi:hypothetical protein
LDDSSVWPAYHLTYEEQVWGYDKEWLLLCDVLLLAGDWKESKGCGIERAVAEAADMWIVEGLDALPEVAVCADHAYMMEQRDLLSAVCRRRLIAGAVKHGDSWKTQDNMRELLSEIADAENYPLLHRMQQAFKSGAFWPPTIRRLCDPECKETPSAPES